MNGDGDINITDASFDFGFCFHGSRPPPAPFPACGPLTPQDELLGCEQPSCP